MYEKKIVFTKLSDNKLKELLDYKYECEQVGYYEYYEPANYSVENNIADIRDHTYDYAMIYEIPMNCMYSNLIK